jgi:PAS domain S-box-containing protein
MKSTERCSVLCTADPQPLARLDAAELDKPNGRPGDLPALPRQINHRILIVDDNPAIHADFHKVLTGKNGHEPALLQTEEALFGAGDASVLDRIFELDSAYQGPEALERVVEALAAGRPYAMAFVDVRMPPGWDGIETITRIWQRAPDLQVVICTAYSDYSWSEMIASLGSPDNLVILKKPFDTIEVVQLAHALTRKWELNRQAQFKLGELTRMVAERTRALEQANQELRRQVQERLQAEAGLRMSEERFSQAFKASPMPLSIERLKDHRYVDVNESFVKLTGYPREQLIGHSADLLGIWGAAQSQCHIRDALASGKPLRNCECQFHTRKGDVRQALVSTELLTLGAEPYLLMLAQDITERIQLERQFRQAQKMEAIGQLAAGVAHDFNNILTVIQGYGSMLQLRLGEDGPHAKPVSAILASSERASNLVRQLLMFSRKRIMQFGNVELNETIQSLSGMLRDLVGEHICVETECEPGLPLVYADRGMIEQVIVNLTVNSRDAISKSGRIVLRTAVATVDHGLCEANPEARAGRFVCVTVGDDGCGIAPELLPHLFEPFFTTKEVGKGTGLGLATVYGIVRQHQGWINVASEPGVGTEFRIYLPFSDQTLSAAPESKSQSATPPGTETILVAEDEPSLREMVSDTLSMCGYRVLLARSGPTALEIWKREEGRIDLVLTDMVMPGGMMGTDLAAELQASNPEVKVIFTTGYSPGVNVQQAPLREGVNFLPKPYSPHTLASLVRRCLDSDNLSAVEPASSDEG